MSKITNFCFFLLAGFFLYRDLEVRRLIEKNATEKENTTRKKRHLKRKDAKFYAPYDDPFGSR